MTDGERWQRHHNALKERGDRYKRLVYFRWDRHSRLGWPELSYYKRLRHVDGWNLEQWLSSQKHQMEMMRKHNGESTN